MGLLTHWKSGGLGRFPSEHRDKDSRQLLRSNSPLIELAVRVRKSAGFFNDFGEFEEGATSRDDFQTITAPVSGEERLALPEGIREETTRRFWTDYAIRGLTDGADSDVIAYLSEDWRVEVLQDWGGFLEIVAVRIQA